MRSAEGGVRGPRGLSGQNGASDEWFKLVIIGNWVLFCLNQRDCLPRQSHLRKKALIDSGRLAC